MQDNLFIKAFNIVKDSPFITLYFVLYLILFFMVIPFVLGGKNFIVSSIMVVLLMLLTCAFMAGWFGVIKCSSKLYKKDKTPEEKLHEAIELKNSFFACVSEYILPVIFGFLLFIILMYLHSYISDLIFGRIDEVLASLSKYANDPTAFKNYFISMPDATWAVIFKKVLFSYVVLSVITVYLLISSSSLYMNEKCSKNPILALFEGLKIMFVKKPGLSLVILFIIMALNFTLIFLQTLFIENVIISFIVMILRIYFAAYIVVLIFALYDDEKCKNALNCDNGPDSIGQDSACN